jgi:hypothetical protein
MCVRLNSVRLKVRSFDVIELVTGNLMCVRGKLQNIKEVRVSVNR